MDALSYDSFLDAAVWLAAYFMDQRVHVDYRPCIVRKVVEPMWEFHDKNTLCGK